jgi:hypothetical protein
VRVQEYIENILFSTDKFKLVRIGRSKYSEVSFEGFTLSRIHTSFVFSDGVWFVNDGIGDKNSTNGTFIYLDLKCRIEKSLCIKFEKNLFRIVKHNES